jgi:hypothetical protein
LVRGLPLSLRERAQTAKPPLFEQIARARAALGTKYFRCIDFDQLLASLEADPQKLSTPEGRLYLALALALRHGPEGAAAMMNMTSLSAYELRNTEALDALAAEPGYLYSGMASFNAARLRSMSPPDKAGAAWFNEVAARFTDAESKLSVPAEKAKAREAAEAARATAKALQ